MKHMFGAVSAAALAVSMALPAVAEDGLKIGMTFQEMNNPYFVSMQDRTRFERGVAFEAIDASD